MPAFRPVESELPKDTLEEVDIQLISCSVLKS